MTTHPDVCRPGENLPAFVLWCIDSERKRQHALKAEGRFKYTPSEVPAVRGSAMLSEENGEVARAALAISGFVQEDLTPADYFKECVQVAAVAMALAEGVILFNQNPGGHPLLEAS